MMQTPSPSPLSVAPPHAVVRPHVLGHLRPGDLRPVWPNAAYQDRRGGKAILDCRVGVDTRLHDCRVLAEGPAGYGFGRAALQVVDQLRASPRMVDGVAVEGGRLRLPVVFDNAGFTSPPYLPRPPRASPATSSDPDDGSPPPA